MPQRAIPRESKWFLYVRIAVQNERHELRGMVADDFMSPCDHIRFPRFAGCDEFFKPRQASTGSVRRSESAENRVAKRRNDANSRAAAV
jgi:hypothetical protein